MGEYLLMVAYLDSADNVEQINTTTMDESSLASNIADITFSAFSSEEAMKIDNCDLLYSSAF